jgi:amino acid permease
MKYNTQMSKARILLILGTWIAILPFLGFPYSWKDILFSLSGLGVIYVSYSLYKEKKKKEKVKNFDNFSENTNFKEIEKAEKEITEGETKQEENTVQ